MYHATTNEKKIMSFYVGILFWLGTLKTLLLLLLQLSKIFVQQELLLQQHQQSKNKIRKWIKKTSRWRHPIPVSKKGLLYYHDLPLKCRNLLAEQIVKIKQALLCIYFLFIVQSLYFITCLMCCLWSVGGRSTAMHWRQISSKT